MDAARAIGMELVKGLAVLALVFLSFGHQNQAFVVSGTSVAVAFAGASFCGEGPNGSQADPGPCHACRAGVADLPRPSGYAQTAYWGFLCVVGTAEAVLSAREAGHVPGNPRAPPIPV